VKVWVVSIEEISEGRERKGKTMNLIIIIVVLLLLFGGGGFYWRRRR
jgi:LPXTG-motif cell wall-anchored protein